MVFLNQILQYLVIILVITIIGAVAVFAGAYYLIKKKKIASTEEKINYDRFTRTDSMDYIKFKDIVTSGSDGDLTAPGMIVLGNNTFVAGLSVRGYNYYGASDVEREKTILNYIAYMNIVDRPMQLKQTSRSIDIEHNIQSFTELAKKIELQLIDEQEDYSAACELLKDDEIIDNDDAYAALTGRLDKLKRKIESLKWELSEAKNMIRYMTDLSATSAKMRRINQIFFSYTYNPNEQMEELSEAEIYEKAFSELTSTAHIHMSALEDCGCSCSILSAEELIDSVYGFGHPLTADDMKVRDLMNSSYASLFVTSDDLRQLEIDRVGHDIYAKEQAELAAEAEEAKKEAVEVLRQAKAVAQKEADMMYEAAKQQMQKGA